MIHWNRPGGLEEGEEKGRNTGANMRDFLLQETDVGRLPVLISILKGSTNSRPC